MSNFLDTSMLVRYLTNDPPELANISAEIIENEDIEISDVVLAEAAHVLRTVYRKLRIEIIDRLLEFINLPNVSVFGLDDDLVDEALLLCRSSNRVSIPDALIWAVARSQASSIIFTLDERFPSLGVEIRRSRGA